MPCSTESGESEPPVPSAALLSHARILNDLAEGVLLAGPDQRIVFANDAAARIFGVPCAELLVPLATYPERFHLRTPRGARALTLASRALAGEVVEPIDRLIHTADGRDRTLRTSAAPVLNDDGAVIGAIVLVDDITDEKRAEVEQARFAAIVESSDDAIISKDLAGIVLTWNPAAERLFGYTAGEMVGAPIARLVPSDREGEEERILEELRAGHRIDHFETTRLRKDGARVEVSVTVSPLFDESGEITGASKIARDITERKRAEQALLESEEKLRTAQGLLERQNEDLREADRRKTEFLGILSHELRNPLAPIRNAIFLLERLPAETAQAARARQVIRRQAEHLTRLVDDLLDVTRISRGKIRLQREVVDVRDVVRRTCEDHRALFEESGIAMRLEMPVKQIWVAVDQTRIAQVIGNLLTNANKFTPEGGVVAVAVSEQDGFASVRVRDSGIGMDPHSVARMFEAFAQEDRSLARTKGGLGLGLALAQGFVQLHGGMITARSDGPGKGSEFELKLPIVPHAPARIDVSPAPAVQRRKALRILVVEDNTDAARTLADVLETMGHHVTLARDGATGIALARKLHPDIVICDIGLPDLDGYEVARELRADHALRDTRIIALSGYAQPEDRERAQEAGFDAHLPKPAPIDDLAAMLA